MPMIEIDQETDQYLEFAARVAGMDKGQVVAQLVHLAKASTNGGDKPGTAKAAVLIHAVYEGHRTHAQYIRGVGRIEITDGPLAGQAFKTPSEAAKAVVSHHNPDVTANRNGWTFWLVTDGGAPLQTIRYDDI
ncbi:MAG TPA: hypothetical protein VF062_14950 [Candidatus Limnocylindrales bacterium]